MCTAGSGQRHDTLGRGLGQHAGDDDARGCPRIDDRRAGRLRGRPRFQQLQVVEELCRGRSPSAEARGLILGDTHRAARQEGRPSAAFPKPRPTGARTTDASKPRGRIFDPSRLSVATHPSRAVNISPPRRTASRPPSLNAPPRGRGYDWGRCPQPPIGPTTCLTQYNHVNLASPRMQRFDP